MAAATELRYGHARLAHLPATGVQASKICGEACLPVETTIVLQRLPDEQMPISLVEGRDVWWHDALPAASPSCEVEWLDSEDPHFVLYTSGSTGKPKGVLHTVGGYMVYAATTTKYVFDLKTDDVFFCTADCGWITGHSYVAYGPLLNGATQARPATLLACRSRPTATAC